jgi:hypothetical protein
MTEGSHEMVANPLPPGERVEGSVGGRDRCGDPHRRRKRRASARGSSRRGRRSRPGDHARLPRRRAGERGAFFSEWFRTGDLGIFSDGYLRLVGRIKEINHPRRRKNLTARDRGRPPSPPGGQDGGRLRHPRREVRPGRRRRDRAGRRGGVRRAPHTLPRARCAVQGPGRPPRRRRDPADADGQSAAVAHVGLLPHGVSGALRRFRGRSNRRLHGSCARARGERRCPHRARAAPPGDAA